MTSHDPEVKLMSQYAYDQYLKNSLRCYLSTIADSLLWGSMVGYPCDSSAVTIGWMFTREIITVFGMQICTTHRDSLAKLCFAKNIVFFSSGPFVRFFVVFYSH